MGRPKKTQEAHPQGEKPKRKEFSEVPAEDSPEYVDYIKSIRVSNDEPKDKKSFGQILKDANQAREDKARKLKEAAAKRAKDVSEGNTVKK